MEIAANDIAEPVAVLANELEAELIVLSNDVHKKVLEPYEIEILDAVRSRPCRAQRCGGRGHDDARAPLAFSGCAQQIRPRALSRGLSRTGRNYLHSVIVCIVASASPSVGYLPSIRYFDRRRSAWPRAAPLRFGIS
jgi:hypothetical protein